MGYERMKDSDVLRDLISLAFDRDPADAEITLRDCLDLLSRTVAAEQRNGSDEAGERAKAERAACAASPNVADGTPDDGTTERAVRAVRSAQAANRGDNDRAEVGKPKMPQGGICLSTKSEELSTRPRASRSVTVGRGAAEKRAIYERLAAYRRENGLGCFARLEKAANGAVTETELHAMLDAEPLPLAKWRAAAAALDRVEGGRANGKL